MKNKEVIFLLAGIVLVLALSSVVSAGVGIKFDRESALVNEGDKTCLTYSVYNPWPEESYVKIEVSDQLKEVLSQQESEVKLIPANTASNSAIPIKFCFKIPQIYIRDCWVGSLICRQECKEEQKVYSGEVLVKSVQQPASAGGSGGSATSMSVSAPLNLRIRCNAHARDFKLIYVVIAVITALIVLIVLYKKYRKPKVQRDLERLKKLKDQIRKEKGKKK